MKELPEIASKDVPQGVEIDSKAPTPNETVASKTPASARPIDPKAPTPGTTIDKIRSILGEVGRPDFNFPEADGSNGFGWGGGYIG